MDKIAANYMVVPKVGEVWRWLGRGESSDESFTFVGVGRNWEKDKIFVFNRVFDGEIFVITKYNFFAERQRWLHDNG